jgi:2-haloacid dehalogenase
MSFDPDRVTTVTFDSYSTVVDVEAAGDALTDFVTDPEPVSNLWRAHSLMYTMVANHVDAYQPFYEMNRDALTHALDAHGVDYTEAERDDVLSVYMELDVFPDIRDGMERLTEAGYDCYIVSNGDPRMLDALVDHADIADVVTDTVSADEIATFKPAADLYRHAAGRVGTPIEEIAHVTAGWFDVQGAEHAGMQGVWLDRKGDPWVSFGDDPSLTATNLHEFADELGA